MIVLIATISVQEDVPEHDNPVSMITLIATISVHDRSNRIEIGDQYPRLH